MKYKFKIVEKVDHHEWDNNIKKSEYGTFFQSAEYLNINRKDRFPIFIFVLDENENICGQLALTIFTKQKEYSTTKLSKFFNVISKLGNRATWVSGPIILTKEKTAYIEILKTFTKALEEISTKYKVMIIDGYSPPLDSMVDDDYKNQFKKSGFKIENLVTFVTDLTIPFEEIEKKFEKKARNDINRAKRRNISVMSLSTKQDFEKYKNVVREWAKTKGIEIENSSDSFENDWNYYKSGFQSFFLSIQDNEILSGLRVGHFNGIAYTHQVLSTYSKPTSLGGTLLTWHALEWAKKKGMKIYDFSGILAPPEKKEELESYNKKWLGLKEYKKKWGGTEKEYYHFVKISKEKSYKLFRALSKPDFIYREHKRKSFQISNKSK